MDTKTKKDNTYCCVPQCKAKGSRNPELHFHKFPNDKVSGDWGRMNVRRKKEWILAIKIGKEVTNRMRVCSKHFKESDYSKGIYNP